MKELVTLQNEQAITTSLKVAEVFEKRHDRVLRAIEKAISTLPKNGVSENFMKTTYKDSTGKTNLMYYLTRDAFSFVAMGFTGEKAAVWKWKYIQAFNAMQEKIIEMLAERRSYEKFQARKASILSNNKLKETIQQELIPLAREQGATAEDKIFYINYNRAVNNAAGIAPKSRDNLSISQLYEVDKIQDMVVCSIKGLVLAKTPYKQIYTDTKQSIKNYAELSFISQRFLN